ncbi:hypothetical protein IQ07DRAFT_585943 [Pyrenochaeta sp. DS3sAY3a]|nr:hypothetical protein IQ07DRAFT_585943 [Pyrenochaeta sp. DS3sAY3a]
MRQSIAILSVLANLAVSQEVLSFFFPGGYDGVSPVATVQTVKPSTTEFLVACPTGVAVSECGWGPGLEYSIISGTHYQASFSYDTFSMSFGCDYNTKATEMTCSASTSIGDEQSDSAQTAVFSSSEISFVTATVVEGASLLGGASATPAPSSARVASTAASLASSTLSPSASGSARSQASGSGSSPSSSASSPASTGAAARFGIEGSALLALAGAAALNAW